MVEENIPAWQKGMHNNIIDANTYRITELEKMTEKAVNPFEEADGTTKSSEPEKGKEDEGLAEYTKNNGLKEEEIDDRTMFTKYYEGADNEKFKFWAYIATLLCKTTTGILIIWKFGNTINNAIGRFGGFI